MENFEIFGVPSLKKGSGIHIKAENKGKFKDYCGGEVTDECIQRGKNSSNSTTKKRAIFADNARHFKHESGAKIHKPNGHRSVLDNGWIPTKELKKKHKLVSFNQSGTVKGGLQPSRNWDKTLAGKLINYSENPDSVGWDAKHRRWYAPPANKGYDVNQFGMGVDRNQTEGFAELVKKDSKGREYLTEEDERYLRHLAIDKANDSANARYRHAQRATGIKGGVSPKHDAITISAIYNLGSGRVARTIFENMTAMKALFDRNSDAYQKAVHEEYRKKDRNERIENELEFFNQ